MSRIDELRKIMEKYGIDAYIVLSDDFHGSEYVGEYFKVREFLSGFDGSAGSMVITNEEAGLWTDGRYYLQAESQLAGSGITLYKDGQKGVPSVTEYLRSKADSIHKIGYDGRTVSCQFAEMLRKALPQAEVESRYDLADEIWTGRPPMSSEPVWLLDEKYSGMSRKDKLEAVRRKMTAERHLVASLDDIAWILNMRGADIEYNPVALAYLLIEKEDAFLYIDSKKVSDDIRSEFEKDRVYIREYNDIYEDLGRIEGPVMADTGKCNTALISAAKNADIIHGKNPSELMKACKNNTETENERAAHLKDGIALTKFIYRLKHSEGESEMSAAVLLEEYRKQQDDYLGQSFAPIIASGDHGAIVHYEADESTDRPLDRDGFILMDTGGHYLQGTTDVTRTITLGRLTDEEKRLYTAVLKGNLNISDAYFAKGCSGNNIDYLAREPLWAEGYDYNHGTGHGVGYLLNVHEGPNAIRLRRADTPFEEGMITSNEPGVYLEGKFGIRLENLVCAHENDGFMHFETLTLVPFERDAIVAEMLTERQKETLNSYHERVYESLKPYMNDDEKKWLYDVTRPVN